MLNAQLPRPAAGRERRPSALCHTLPVTTLVLGSFYYWFAIADRYIVFLYYHDMGPRVPDTSPFSAATSGRYWMAGLVASGLVMVLYTGANWLLGRLVAGYRAPAWPRVWIACAVPLAVLIPAITMTVNHPTLPAWNAAQVTLATLAGLVLALMPGAAAAEHPAELAWLILDGCALAAVLLYAVAYYPLRIAGLPDPEARTWAPVVACACGTVWLLGMTALRAWRRVRIPSAAAVLAAGLALAYPLMILVHHLLGTDGYFYISTAENFFAASPLQIGLWLVVAAMALGITWLRRRAGLRE